MVGSKQNWINMGLYQLIKSGGHKTELTQLFQSRWWAHNRIVQDTYSLPPLPNLNPFDQFCFAPPNGGFKTELDKCGAKTEMRCIQLYLFICTHPQGPLIPLTPLMCLMVVAKKVPNLCISVLIQPTPAKTCGTPSHPYRAPLQFGILTMFFCAHHQTH